LDGYFFKLNLGISLYLNDIYFQWKKILLDISKLDLINLNNRTILSENTLRIPYD